MFLKTAELIPIQKPRFPHAVEFQVQPGLVTLVDRVLSGAHLQSRCEGVVAEPGSD